MTVSDAFIEFWLEIVMVIVAVLGLFSAVIYRYKQLDENKRKRVASTAKRREAQALEIKDLQKNNQALEDRVNRLSRLCERFITIQGDAMIEATAARTASETITGLINKRHGK